MTTGKTIAFTRRTVVDKVMSLLFNMMSRDCNVKVGSQETPGVQANLALEYGMKQGKG